MNYIKSMFKNLTNTDIILGIIVIIYIFGDFQTPHVLAPYLTNLIAYAIMIVILCITISKSSLLLTIILAISFVVLVSRSHQSHPMNIMPSQNNRDTIMNNLNDNNRFNNINSRSKQELEEYMVENISTIDFRNESTPATFKPIVQLSPTVTEL